MALNGNINNKDDRMAPSRQKYKPAIPGAYRNGALPPSPLTTYLEDKKKSPEKPSLAVRVLQSHFLVKLPAIMVITLVLSCLSRTGTQTKTETGTHPPPPAAFLYNLLRTTTGTFALQVAVALPSVLLRTEMLFGLSGPACFVLVIARTLDRTGVANLLLDRPEKAGSFGAGHASVDASYFGGDGALEVVKGIAKGIVLLDGRVWEDIGVNWRQGLVMGIFAFIRALCLGGDSRFDNIRTDRIKFFMVFITQAQAFTSAGQGTSNPISALTGLYQTLWFWLGILAFFRGLMIECVADWQLSKWRFDKYRKKHNDVFCGKGLWNRSRHPNYYGECLLWLGISISCSAVLLSSDARRTTGLGVYTALVLCALTPYFVYKLVRTISVPLIEGKHDRMYMTREDYRDWRRNSTFCIWLDGSGIIWGYI
ncbi:hypothetical protein C7999DRAFT_39178 [Corynascus novoguineensis]|uniref:Steroid 5-alpha reductase C-terminal domain-containing protein n=1 Tax=Corynascus novoguineensis TaxID=1126955 RepID=A0AAN7CWI7_9PEZI|nr:hypothetical protein C7999DRAFT_39178 [Corynascus novoguineensis]